MTRPPSPARPRPAPPASRAAARSPPARCWGSCSWSSPWPCSRSCSPAGRPRPARRPTSPVPDASAFAYAEAEPAPPLELDRPGRPAVRARRRCAGRPVLVFFGYTHCPDVCPATVGVINQVLTGPARAARGVHLDRPRARRRRRDEVVPALPARRPMSGSSGTPAEIRTNADALGRQVRAAGDRARPAGYAMGHTADVFLVDAQGRLRAHYPFGTGAEAIPRTSGRCSPRRRRRPPRRPRAPRSRRPRRVRAARLARPTAAPSRRRPRRRARRRRAPARGHLDQHLGRRHGPRDPAGDRRRGPPARRERPGHGPARRVRRDRDRRRRSPPRPSSRPARTRRSSSHPSRSRPPGAWRLQLASGGAAGDIPIQALAQGSSVPIGAPAPDVDTPTLDDVGRGRPRGDHRAEPGPPDVAHLDGRRPRHGQALRPRHRLRPGSRSRRSAAGPCRWSGSSSTAGRTTSCSSTSSRSTTR